MAVQRPLGSRPRAAIRRPWFRRGLLEMLFLKAIVLCLTLLGSECSVGWGAWVDSTWFCWDVWTDRIGWTMAAIGRSDRSVDRAIGSIDSIDFINFQIF